MSVLSWVRLGVELGSELWREHQRAKAVERADRIWAETRSTVRACPRCREVAYVPGHSTCSKCGQPLSG